MRQHKTTKKKVKKIKKKTNVAWQTYQNYRIHAFRTDRAIGPVFLVILRRRPEMSAADGPASRSVRPCPYHRDPRRPYHCCSNLRPYSAPAALPNRDAIAVIVAVVHWRIDSASRIVYNRDKEKNSVKSYKQSINGVGEQKEQN